MGSLRIIAGELRHRRIRTPHGLVARPTADRVREALFDILGSSVEEASVLDAYAGSGALGIEALSRGARCATFVESDARVREVLRSNLDGLSLSPRCRLLGGRVEQLLPLGRLGGPFDLVLADPPWGATLAGQFLEALVTSEGLVAGGRVVVERDARTAPPDAPSSLRLGRTARYGGTCLDFYDG